MVRPTSFVNYEPWLIREERSQQTSLPNVINSGNRTSNAKND